MQINFRNRLLRVTASLLDADERALLGECCDDHESPHEAVNAFMRKHEWALEDACPQVCGADDAYMEGVQQHLKSLWTAFEAVGVKTCGVCGDAIALSEGCICFDNHCQ